jgi:iron uptake system EfeUOB component EfeO/EfeM
MLVVVLGAALAVLLLAAALPHARDGSVHLPGLPHPGVAPADNANAKPSIKGVYNSRLSAQETADAADGRPTAAGPRPEVQPLNPSAFHAPVAAYRRYAVRDARAMAAPVAALRAAVARGDRAAAKAAWGKAYDKYLLLGAAYGALGDLDVVVDGTAGGLQRGARDPKFTGLHRVEYGLWTGKSMASLRAPTRRLAADVARLPRKLALLPISPLDYATRAHEILEDAQRDFLSGVAAPWSGAGVRATAAAVAATRVVIGTLHTTLSGRGDALQGVESSLGLLGDELAAIRRAHGGAYPALGALTRRERELLDGRLGRALEALSGIPGALETQLAPAIPALPKEHHR